MLDTPSVATRVQLRMRTLLYIIGTFTGYASASFCAVRQFRHQRGNRSRCNTRGCTCLARDAWTLPSRRYATPTPLARSGGPSCCTRTTVLRAGSAPPRSAVVEADVIERRLHDRLHRVRRPPKAAGTSRSTEQPRDRRVAVGKVKCVGRLAEVFGEAQAEAVEAHRAAARRLERRRRVDALVVAPALAAGRTEARRGVIFACFSRNSCQLMRVEQGDLLAPRSCRPGSPDSCRRAGSDRVARAPAAAPSRRNSGHGRRPLPTTSRSSPKCSLSKNIDGPSFSFVNASRFWNSALRSTWTPSSSTSRLAV